MFKRARYQNGCLTKERRKSGPAVWIFRFRDADNINRKNIVGTVEQYPTKAAARKATEHFRVVINGDSYAPRTFSDLVTHYTAKELPSKTPYTVEVYQGYLDNWIVPKWGDRSLSEIRTVGVEEWLRSLVLSDGTKAKLRNLMSAIFNHGIRFEFTFKNPITGPNKGAGVRQSAKRQRTPEILDAEEIKSLLAVLDEPYRTMVFLAASTGLRVSELMGLQWQDIESASDQIRLRRGVVRQHVGEMKTEASRKPIPLSLGLAEVLAKWREQTPYGQTEDWVFASPALQGSQPYWPNSAMERHIRPAANKACIPKRVGWHTFRHSFATLLKANGEDVKTVQESLRHANSRITLDTYTQAITPVKREAQQKVVEMIRPVSGTDVGANWRASTPVVLAQTAIA